MEIIDFYKFVEGNPLFRQMSVDDVLFTAYDCPLEGSPVDYSTEKNYFCYVFVGGGRWKTPTEEYTLRAGDAAFLKKGVHRVFKILNGDFCALLIFMPDEFISSVLKHETDLILAEALDEETDSVIPLALNRSLIQYFNSLMNYFSESDPPSKSLLKVKFKELIINIATGGHNPLATRCFKEIAATGRKSIKVVMEENFIFNLKLKDFAALSNRSLASFNRDFTKIYGTTPGKWLKRKRLDYAKYLLETTDLNINEITLESGFENTSHFIRSFKAHFKSAPMTFKKQMLTKV
ncbi:AraC family transcriptional regulator [Muriicola sp. Z0-33]|uniref:AraC family transcriptional regulator n=1 Tax=Muriicola sp. Z0-33 TaxID=2816957 RepID=UPI0022390047|nr:AraC family transcriptional regulator [Muriicola sp. Z0-33]MCW5515425.1 helix-turn-helix transcriptional regulator [Muriicola sp. Z0-33]